MSWHPNDLVTDLDLEDYEAAVVASFGQTTWQGKRTKALEDWLFPILAGKGFDPYRLRTRIEPTQVWSTTGGTYTDRTSAARSTTDDDLNVAAIIATPSTDAIYLGSDRPFRGIFWRLLEAVSTASGVMSVAYWNGSWESLILADGTIQTAGKTLSASGSVTWVLPVDWMTRVVNASDPQYWVKVTLSATPTSATAGQVSLIRASAFRAPVTFRTLELIFREAPTGADGPWLEKADYYKQQADDALSRALVLAGGEFDTDESDTLSADELTQTAEETGGGVFRWERG